MNRFILFGITLASCATLAGQAHAYSTNLINFPIADILKNREGMYTIGANGFARNVNKGFTWAQTATFGILDRAEVGVSNDLMGHTLYDGKLQLLDNPKEGYAASFGIAAYDADAKTNDVFFSVRKDFSNFRLHAEAYRAGKIKGVFGVDFAFKGGWSGAVETETGTNSQTWVAFTSPELAKNLTAMVTSRMPWDGGTGPQYQVVLNYGFRF